MVKKVMMVAHTHTHNRFTALLEYVRDHADEQKGKTRQVIVMTVASVVIM